MAKRNKTINTAGGVSVGKNVQTDGGDFVGRDQLNFFVSPSDWEKLREFLSKSNTSNATQQKWQKFDWAKAEQAYLDKVIKLYDRVRILGNSVDVPLGNIFTQVYVLDKLTARQRHDIEALRKQGWDRFDIQYQPSERRQGLDLVKINQNLFILGKPGAGKTTFLKYITIQAARKQLPRIPIFISLNQWAQSKWGKGDHTALLPFIVEQFAICDFPDAELFIDYLLQEGRALLLFDGLDEVKQEKDQRRRLIYLLQDFTNKYNKSQHLITCRIAASDYAFAGFADVEVADFTAEQVHEYARRWFGDQEKKFEVFTSEITKPENRGLAELCNTPLLLSLLCLTFDNNMSFPPSRAELYEDALETLLRKWDSNREIQRDEIYHTLSHKRKLQMLMNIAVPTFEKGELFFRQRDLERWIVGYLAKLPGAPLADTSDGTAILKAIEAQHSILVERAQGIYSFSHLTFQEYLTARYVTENQGRGVTNKLIRSHLVDQRWREIFLLTASLLDDANDYVIAMRYATNEIIVDTPTIINLLNWAHEQANQTNISIERSHFVKLAYVFLALTLTLSFMFKQSFTLASAVDRTRALDRARELDRSFARIIDRAHNLARALDQHSANTLDRALTHALGLAHALDFTRNSYPDHALYPDHTLNPALDLAHLTAALVGFDYELCYAWTYGMLFASEKLDLTKDYWQIALQQFPNLMSSMSIFASQVGLPTLARQIAILPHPLYGAHGQEWQKYAEALFILLHDERNLKCEWNLSDKENNKLNDYFYSNELLVQCLKIAVVSDRQAILNSLLLPPQAE